MTTNIIKLKSGMIKTIGSNIMLTSCILLANINLADLLDYALKATIGGGIWLIYKIAGDYLDQKKKEKK